uniref:N-alpha-acetyltransferase 80, NatH catalytic subunit n=1 Tax=Callorhinchus milii TaxID=7868 RepID=A0A4W3KA62_CALMI
DNNPSKKTIINWSLQSTTVFPLHLCPELMETCADLINEEWKRSKASRIHSLQKSSNNFPVCLVLLRPLKIADGTGSKTKSQLVGHSKLSRVVGQASGLFVETVVVAKEYRGKGYGRKLMESTEAYAKFRGFKTLYLTTHDKQYFYFHLGYTLCKPVQNLHRPALSPNLYCLPLTPTFSPSQSHPLSSSLQLPNSLSDSITGLPAPPLLPELISTPSSQFPHSPEPSNIPGDINAPWRIEATQSLLETPYQDVKGLPVFWMKKNIYLIKSA